MSELTSISTPRSASSRQTLSASSKLPLTSATFAATARDCADLAAAIAPCGVSTTAVRPARAPYAAADAAVLPVDAQTMPSKPSSTAFATATHMPRSLNEPVGFMPSNLK